MPTIFIGDSPDGFDLNSPITNPVTVTGTIAFGTIAPLAALQGETVAAWNITNKGSILGATAVGIELLAGGTITYTATSLVSGMFAIAIQGTAGTVVNAGILDASAAGAGVYLSQGGSVTNQDGGRIQFGLDGVTARGGAAVVTNAGIISAGTSGGASVDLFAGGNVINQAGGTLTGDFGISIAGASTGSVLNSGVITGGSQAGVLMTGGTATNQAGGTITGNLGISMQGAPGSVTNGGVITGGSQSGVFLNTGGTVANQASGTISGNWGIADVGAAATVISSGTIIGTNGTAVTLPAGFANLLVDNPGAVFNGLADGGNVIGDAIVSTLELGATASQGTLNGLGANFIDFGNIFVSAGASWVLTGANTLAAGSTLTDQGTLLLSAATMLANGAETIDGTASGTASLTVTGGGLWSGTSTMIVGNTAGGSILIDGQGSVAVATAAVGTNAGSSGWIDVGGAGSEFATTSSLTVGQAGGGHLTVEKQAAAQLGGGIDIGAAAGGTGVVSVTGPRSVLTNTGTFVVGDAGLGSLSIDTGGTVITSTGATMARFASASGSTANITGAGSNWQVAGALIVGDAGYGALSLSQGATVTAGSLDVAAVAGSGGAISLSGAGTALNITGVLSVGDQSSGSLNIANGASVSVGGLTIGAGAGGSGNVVIGPGSHLSLTGTTINVGLAGSGVLDIQGGTLGLVAGTTLSPGTFGRIVQVGGLIDPAAVFDASGGSFGGGGTAEASVDILNTSLATVSGLAETLLAPLITSGDTVNVAEVWSIKNSGTLVLDANTVDNSQTIQFGDLTGELVIGQQVTLDATQTPQTIAASALSGFAAPIVGYKTGDTIAFSGLTVASDSVTGNVVTLFDAGHTELGTLTFQTAKGGVDNAGATAAAAQIACFAAGTLIETVTGPRAVETLCVGDEVRTLLGGPGRVVWVGSRTVDCGRHPNPETVWPVRIQRDAFGDALPSRDLLVSPNHALYIDGVFVPAELLVNGTTIRQVKQQHVIYHHVELELHDVVLAEGLPAETYLAAADRGNFGGEDVIQLFPDFGTSHAAETAQVWETSGAAPLVITGPRLDAVRSLVFARATRQGLGCRDMASRPAGFDETRLRASL